MTDTTAEESARQDAAAEMRRRARDEVHRYVRATGGTVAERPISLTRDYGSAPQPEPLAGIRAAEALANTARRLSSDYVTKARQDGIGWDQIGSALGLEPDGYGRTLGEMAFEQAAPEPSQRFDPRRFGFRCGSCTEMVTDSGPYNAHPTDNEAGHAERCPRMLAQVAAYEAERDREEAGWEAGE